MKALPFIVLFLQLDILLATLHGLYTGTELAGMSMSFWGYMIALVIEEHITCAAFFHASLPCWLNLSRWSAQNRKWATTRVVVAGAWASHTLFSQGRDLKYCLSAFMIWTLLRNGLGLRIVLSIASALWSCRTWRPWDTLEKKNSRYIRRKEDFIAKARADMLAEANKIQATHSLINQRIATSELTGLELLEFTRRRKNEMRGLQNRLAVVKLYGEDGCGKLERNLSGAKRELSGSMDLEAKERALWAEWCRGCRKSFEEWESKTLAGECTEGIVDDRLRAAQTSSEAIEAGRCPHCGTKHEAASASPTAPSQPSATPQSSDRSREEEARRQELEAAQAKHQRTLQKCDLLDRGIAGKRAKLADLEASEARMKESNAEQIAQAKMIVEARLAQAAAIEAEQHRRTGILEASKHEAEEASKAAKIVLDSSAEAKAAAEQKLAATKAALLTKRQKGERRIAELQAQLKQTKGETKALQKTHPRDTRLLCLAKSKLEDSLRKGRESIAKKESLREALMSSYKRVAALQTELQEKTVHGLEMHCAEEMATMKRAIREQEVYHSHREALHLRHSHEISQRLQGMKQQNLSLRRQLHRAGL